MLLKKLLATSTVVILCIVLRISVRTFVTHYSDSSVHAGIALCLAPFGERRLTALTCHRLPRTLEAFQPPGGGLREALRRLGREASVHRLRSRL